LSRRFMIGVELLTGLSIGAAAAAAAVAFMTAFLVSRDLEAQSGHMATVTAFALGHSIQGGDPSVMMERVVEPLIRSGSLQGAVVLDPAGRVAASAGETGYSGTEPGESDGWYFAQLPETGAMVGIRPGGSSWPSVYRALITGLAALTAALAVLAMFTPRYLSRTVISPLRDILMEADRFTTGGGADPETAGASFHRLVELLHEREQQLNEMRQKAEERAERIEKRSSAILSVLGSAVLAVDSAGLLLLFNQQSRDLFELDFDDVGRDFPWDRTEAGRMLRPLLFPAAKGASSSGEFQLAQGQGLPDRIYSVEISRSRGDEIAVLVTDVTRIGELERRIADQTAMADMGAASAGISHEMGNTLCALSGFVDLLARGHSDTRTSNILEEVRREVDSARALISSFGSFARSPVPQTARLDRDDLEEMCREVCSCDTRRCSVEIRSGEISLSADPKLLSSCLRNIVRNALEADPSSEVEVAVDSSGGSVVISVRDNGPGLSMDSEEVFRPFRSTKESSRGNMGLGLPVSRRIIRAMGGELSGRDLPEGGAVFEIVLPPGRE